MQPKTLLVDDDPLVLRSLQSVLQGRGFLVSTARSGHQAIENLRKKLFDLIVTDMRMETSTAGFEVVKAARAQAHRPVTVILSAFPISGGDWRSSGADAMLMKADISERRLEELERLLERRGRKQPERKRRQE